MARESLAPPGVGIPEIENGAHHPYLQGIRKELEANFGIYIFHDSRGRALYVGKARRQNLWREIRGAFNRGRKVQKIRRVRHPERKQTFKRAEEKKRQILAMSVPLHSLATYVSAYRVSDGLIGELESLLIRAFPNDLSNIRMENFGSTNNATRTRNGKTASKRVAGRHQRRYVKRRNVRH